MIQRLHLKKDLQWCMASQATYMHLPRGTVDKLWHELVSHTLSTAKLSLPKVCLDHRQLFSWFWEGVAALDRTRVVFASRNWGFHLVFFCTCINFTPLCEIFYTVVARVYTHCITQSSCTGFTVLVLEGGAFYICVYVVWHGFWRSTWVYVRGKNDLTQATCHDVCTSRLTVCFPPPSLSLSLPLSLALPPSVCCRPSDSDDGVNSDIEDVIMAQLYFSDVKSKVSGTVCI